MSQLNSYILGEWQAGTGDGTAMYNAINGELIGHASTDGLDIPAVLEYGRTKGGEKIRKMTFQERGNMLKKLALYLTKRKDQFYEISYKTGATKADSWIDIEGGFGNLFANASLRKLFPNQSYHVEGDPVDLSRGGRFMAHHILVPKAGVAVHINAFNFPIWGMLEKCAVNWMAGMPSVVLPAPQTAFLTEALVRVIIDSKILPEGSLQLLSGMTKNILDTVTSQDVVTFTGSASTGKLLKAHPRLVEESVPFTMEADSLNCSILGEDATPGTPEFDLFVKEVRKEMTVKCGQKCTAIRRIIVPEDLMDEVQKALSAQLDKVTIGDPSLKEVRMGALINRTQVDSVKTQVEKIAATANIVYGSLENINPVGADGKKGAFLSPILMREENPFGNHAVHEIEAFGPVSTIMPYKNLNEAVELAKMGKGSLVSSIFTYNDDIAREYTVNAATHHGRILIGNRENSKESTGHGSPLPYLVHGGPGRAGGGEEMGGMRGIKHYMQRCAIQGTPTTITEITGIYQANAKYKESPNHPFSYHFEDIQPGMSLKTHKRTITDSDIINFANLTWDHFYAHTDITSLEGSIFEKRAAHGYFLLAGAAGLFVYPNKGPVAANYGLEECRFLKPIYHNDTVYVRLTCKQKIERDWRGKELPAGVVQWYVEMFDQEDELVSMATILTLVQKKNPFYPFDEAHIDKALNRLQEDTAPKWGILKPQHMVEHLQKQFEFAIELEIPDLVTPEQYLETMNESVYNHIAMPKNYEHPLLKKGELEVLRFDSLAEAKAKLKESIAQYHQFFKENPGKTTLNPSFGELNKFEWDLLNRKHFDHHFQQFGLI